MTQNSALPGCKLDYLVLVQCAYAPDFMSGWKFQALSVFTLDKTADPSERVIIIRPIIQAQASPNTDLGCKKCQECSGSGSVDDKGNERLSTRNIYELLKSLCLSNSMTIASHVVSSRSLRYLT